MKTIWAGALALGLTATDPAQAAVLWDFTETAAGIEGTLSGTLDLSGGRFAFAEGALGAPVLAPRGGTLDAGLGGHWFAFAGAGLPAFGDGIGHMQGETRSATGAQFALAQGAAGEFLVGVSAAFASGDALAGTMRLGTTFEALGIAPGTYVAALPFDTITVRFTGAQDAAGAGTDGSLVATPLPGALPLLGGALGLLALRRRRA